MGSMPNLHVCSSEEDQPLKPLCRQQLAVQLSNPVHGGEYHLLAGGQHRRCRGRQHQHRSCHHHFGAQNTRHRRTVTKQSSVGSGMTGNLRGGQWDDITLEVAAYSPMSCRSARSTRSYCSPRPPSSSNCGAAPNLIVAANAAGGTLPTANRVRLDSLSGSSTGGASVRHLISLVRSTPSALGPVYSERALLRLHAALCLAAASTAAAIAPPLALASSVLRAPPVFGAAALPALSHALAAVSAVAIAAMGPGMLRRAGPSRVAALAHFAAAGFSALHLLPPASAAASPATACSLGPAYALLGLLTLGPLPAAHAAFLSSLSAKLSLSSPAGSEPATVLLKLARHLQLSQHFGQVLGNGVAALVLWTTLPKDASDELEVLFALDEDPAGDGGRRCGAAACPVDPSASLLSAAALNGSSPTDGGADYLSVALPCKTAALLSSVLLGCCAVGAILAAACLGRVRLFPRAEPAERLSANAAIKSLGAAFSDRRLRLAAPLFLFIGMEQAFMLADFTKSYVACALGLPEAALASLCLGLLQSVAAFILSILLHHVQRYVVIVAGFLFHACLLLVLLMWKASGDDPALFYVISAAWGVCNAIWETLTFSLRPRRGPAPRTRPLRAPRGATGAPPTAGAGTRRHPRGLVTAVQGPQAP
ncbi:putative potassium channel regulatory protein unc-93 isoform X2 [Ischnura elegans]|uniref:putative potassium channel regulatory protein unc-93 isoform X2 n=1 Tax=Ischnura elegans TaxID=197161 RepID=UPI001ED8B26B|nr:putative potassium channel regulatory protein unc-93 isoform X2 [Ischnura elegans]